MSSASQYGGMFFYSNGKAFTQPEFESIIDGWSPPRHIVILGVARGGTTALARVLSELDMHTEMPNEFMESWSIKKLYDREMYEGIVRHIESWGSDGKRMFVKEPKLRTGKFSPYLPQLPTNVGFIFIFRDILNIALRNTVALEMEIGQTLSIAARDMVKLVAIFESLRNKSIALVSYEKMVANPERTVRNIARFLGIEDGAAVQRAISCIDPGSQEYEAASSAINYKT